MSSPLDFDIIGLQKALRNTPSDVTSGLLRNMLESFRERICLNECQFNRVVCILRPKCPQRHFLDLLLNSGYTHAKIPQFCYSVRLKEINENYSKDIYSLTSDITIFLADFYRIFGTDKTRFHYKRDFTKILTFFEVENVKQVEKNYVLGLKKNLIYIEFDKEMVVINPSKWVLLDPKMLTATLEVLSQEYNIKIEVTEQYEHNLVLTFSFPNSEEQLNENQFDDAIRFSDTLMSYDSETNEVFGELHIPQANAKNFQEFNVEKLRKIFEDLDAIRPIGSSESIKEVSVDKSSAKIKSKK